MTADAIIHHHHLIDIHAFRPQILPGHINFLHEFCVRLRYVVECKDAPAELSKEVGAEGDESPERELEFRWLC